MSMTETPPPAGPTWKVIAQTPVSVPLPTGGYGPGYRITAQLTATGTTFQVDVPAGQYNADNVKTLLAAQAAHVGAVDGLTG